MKRYLMYQLIAIILAIAILAQPFAVIANNEQVTQHRLDMITEPLHAEELNSISGDSSSNRLITDIKQSVQLVEGNNTSVFLPLIMSPPGPPDFEIIAPTEGWTVSGMMFFAAQPRDPRTMSSITFYAGSTILGTDNTPLDGYKAFFDASAFPAGALTLTAVASGPSGQTTENVTVNVVPSPPQSGTIGSAGGVLASEIGSTITFPPGALPNGTTVSVDELTQEEVANQTGIDWDAMGVTFLGAQSVQSTSSFALPLTVSSAGFGNRVQPGQAVVNYRIVPDVNGDGVDEIVVVNNASVAPNNDVISDPVPRIELGSTVVAYNNNSYLVSGGENEITGPLGTLINIEASGFNPGSILGNVAQFQSQIDGSEFEAPIFIQSDENSNLGQHILTTIPDLPVGPATVIFRNVSTGMEVGPININIQAPISLNNPPEVIIDNTLELAKGALDQLEGFAEEGEIILSADIESTKNQMTQLQVYVETISVNPTPEEQEFLNNLATTFQTSNINDYFIVLQRLQPLDWRAAGDMIATGVGMVGATVMAIAAFEAGAAAAFGVGAGMMILAAAWFIARGIAMLLPNPNNGGGIPGMGAAPPPGGNGGGNVLSGGSQNIIGKDSAMSLEPGRFAIKLFSSGSSMPFTGLTDAGGYFFIPLIPEGEPFTAVAFDALTGETRTFSGIGPAIGDSTFMFFDFFTEQVANTVGFDEITSGSIDTLAEIDIYTFNGAIGDKILFRLARISGNLDPRIQVYRPDSSLLCNNQTTGSIVELSCALNISGTHTILVDDWQGDETGTYDLYLQRLNNPTNPTSINFDEVLPVPISPPIDMDAFTFNGTVGDQIFFRLARTSGNLDPQIRVYRPDGTLLCNNQTTGSIVELTCALNVTGLYTILIDDWTGDEAGTFDLYLQRLNNPANPTSIAYSNTLTVTIDPAIDMDSFTFSGLANEQVLLRLTRTSGNLDPQIRVYRPDGTLLCNTQTTSSVAEITCTLNVNGMYNILVDDWSGDEIGTYDIFIELLP